MTFNKQGENTLMSLVHSGLPDTDEGKSHEKGWNYFPGIFLEQFGKGSGKQYHWEEAHPHEGYRYSRKKKAQLPITTPVPQSALRAGSDRQAGIVGQGSVAAGRSGSTKRVAVAADPNTPH